MRNYPAPVNVTSFTGSTKIIKINTNNDFTCLLTIDNYAYCSGHNKYIYF